MYTLDKNTAITRPVIINAIDYNERLKGRFDKLEKYYLGQHDILAREKGDTLKNNKVVVNHAKYIVDTNVGYLLGNPVEYQTNDNHNIDPILDAYKKQTINDLDSEIARDVSIFGLQKEYIYANENAEPRSAEIDNRNSIIVYDNTLEHNKLFGLIYRPIYEGTTFKYYEVIYCDKKVIRDYKCYSRSLVQNGEDKPHMFGDVPMIEYRNNPDYLGDFETVITLIDAYNILQSDRINDKEQLVDAILCMYGIDFDDTQLEMLKENRVLAGIPEDGKVEYLIKTLQETDIDVLRKNLENDIHKISMTPNMTDENFVGNSSGVAIRYKLLAFEQNIKNKERYMEKGLMERMKLYNNFLVTKSQMSVVPTEEVDTIFKRNLPSNDFETSQMINNLADFVDKETLVGQLSFVKDAKEVVALQEKEAKESPKGGYDDAFNKNEIPDANNNPVIPQNKQPVDMSKVIIK